MDLEPQTSDDVVSETADEVTGVWRFVGFLIIGAAAVGIVWLAIAILPDHAPPLGKNPSWLDYIVDNRWVIWLIRIGGLVSTVMFAVFAVYFIRSIRHRIRSGHWLRSGGPFQAEIVEQALADVEPLFQNLADADERNTELDQALTDTNEFLEHLSERLEAAYVEIDRLQAELAAAQQDHPS